jgi:hypothetical protein
MYSVCGEGEVNINIKFGFSVMLCLVGMWPWKWFLLSKFSYLLFSKSTHKTKIGTTNRWEITNSNPPGPIIMIGESETGSTSQIYPWSKVVCFVLFCFSCWDLTNSSPFVPCEQDLGKALDQQGCTHLAWDCLELWCEAIDYWIIFSMKIK